MESISTNMIFFVDIVIVIVIVNVNVVVVMVMIIINGVHWYLCPMIVKCVLFIL